MNRTIISWYALAAVVVLGPVSLRMYCWPKQQNMAVDLTEAEQGRMLFLHEWTVNDPLCGGDGLGPVFNAKSCVTCHHQGGVGGSGGLEHNVNSYISQPGGQGKVTQGVIHASAIDPKFQEFLSHIDRSLPAISQPTLASILPDRGGNDNRAHKNDGTKIAMPHGVHISQRNTPALFGAKLIDDIPDSIMIAMERQQRMRWGDNHERDPVGRTMRHKDGKVGKFGWKAQSISLIDFVEAACANELGLSNPGSEQPTSLAMPAYKSAGYDLTTKQCQQMAAFIGSLPRPIQVRPDNDRDAERVANGKANFSSVGCADCHVPNLGSVKGLYSDLLMHKMGRDLEGIGGYNAPPVQRDNPDGTTPDEWRTPPLWGVADSAPYLHDGRAATLEEAIAMHGGQALQTARRFQQLAPRDRNDLVFFLKSLQAPR